MTVCVCVCVCILLDLSSFEFALYSIVADVAVSFALFVEAGESTDGGTANDPTFNIYFSDVQRGSLLVT